MYITAMGSFMKIVVHKCYSNPHNLFNQVGIIAINILGKPLPASYAGALPAGGANPAAVPKHSKGAGVEDLAVDMGVDPTTAATLRDVHAQKVAAVEAEDYAAAKQLKAIEDSLRSVGGRLARLLADKSAAVEAEDYDRAAALKAEITRIRANIAHQIQAVQAGNFSAAAAAVGGGGMGQAPAPYGGPAYSSAPLAQHQGQGGFGGGHGVPAAHTAPYQPGYGGGAPSDQGYGAPPSHHAGQGEDMYGGVPSMPAHGGPPAREPIYGQQPAAQAPHSEWAPGPGGASDPYGGQPAEPMPMGGGRGNFGAPSDAFQGGPSPHGGGKVAEPEGFAPSAGGGMARTPPRGDTGAPPAGFHPGRGGGGGMDGRPDSRAIRPAAVDLDALIAADEAAQKGQAAAPVPPGLGQASSSVTAAAAAGGGGGKVDAAALAGVEGVADLPAPEPVGAKDAKDAARLEGIFGEYVVQCLMAKTWQLREAAIHKVQLEIPHYTASPQAVLEAVGFLISRVADKDKIAQVFVSAVQLLPVVLDKAAPVVGQAGTTAALDGACTSLTVKLGDNAPKNRDAAVDALLELATRPEVGAATIARHCMAPLPKKQVRGWRAMHTRLMVLAMLVSDQGLLGAGVSPQELIGFSASNKAHDHANGELREAAKQLVVEIFKQVGPSVEGMLSHLNGKQLAEYKAACEASAAEP